MYGGGAEQSKIKNNLMIAYRLLESLSSLEEPLDDALPLLLSSLPSPADEEDSSSL